MVGWDLAILRREQLEDGDVRLIPQEVEAGEGLEWKDIASHLQELLGTWNFLVMRDSMLEHHLDSAS
jgi:hypothetical protein